MEHNCYFRGSTMTNILSVALCFLEILSMTASVKIIYETGDPKDVYPKNHTLPRNISKASASTKHTQHSSLNKRPNVTEIGTKNFLVNITTVDNQERNATVKELEKDRILDLGSPLVRDETPDTTPGTNIPNDVRETLKNALTGEIIGKLSRGELDGVGLRTNTPQRNIIREQFSKRQKLTGMFVRFLEDLANKLNLDVMTVAEQLISRSGDVENTEAEMAAGYARDIIPGVPLRFKPVLKIISKIVHEELASARLLGKLDRCRKKLHQTLGYQQ